MGRINFHVISNEEGTGSFICAGIKEVLNNITCDQFCKLVRRAVHMSILPREYAYVSDSTIEILRKELFPDLSRKSLTSKYHYWKLNSDENSLGYTVGAFNHAYRESEIHISVVVDFRLENKKMVAHVEYSSDYAGKEYHYETLEDILTRFHDDVNVEYKIYEKIKKMHDNSTKKAAPKKLSRKAKKIMDAAPTMTMEELERACELEPDGTYDDI